MSKTLIWLLHIHDVDRFREKRILYYVFRRVTQYIFKTGHDGRTHLNSHMWFLTTILDSTGL